MLKPAILALIRQILTVAGTGLVAKGYVQASDIEPIIGALLTIGSVVWSVADKREQSSCHLVFLKKVWSFRQTCQKLLPSSPPLHRIMICKESVILDRWKTHRVQAH